nr:transposase [Photorhabdus aegyptia]
MIIDKFHVVRMTNESLERTRKVIRIVLTQYSVEGLSAVMN